MTAHFSDAAPISYTWRSIVAPAATAIVAAVACLLAWFLNAVWFALLALIGSGAVGIAIAMQSPRWTTLRIGYCHIVVWFLVGLVAAAFSIRICLAYNEIAGTDKTPLHIAQISAGVFSGPMVGPIANPGAGQRDHAAVLTAVLLFFVAVSATPFVFVRRAVPRPIAMLAWTGFLATTVLWYLGALVSLGVFLS